MKRGKKRANTFPIKRDICSFSHIDSDGKIVVKYKCDAWGNHTVLGGSGNINPFRYKCYYYDKETNMYYCESRYYVPEWCRWLNGDSIGFINTSDIHGMNLFAYCSNNPVMLLDRSGNFALLAIIIGMITVTAAVAATASDIYQITEKKVYVDMEKTNSENVNIHDSYKITTPWVKWGYSVYLNYFNPNTKDTIKGSTFGVEFEWMVHNVLAWIGLGGDRAKNLDVGPTIFADGKYHPLRDKDGKISLEGLGSIGMRIGYLTSNPVISIIELILNGGF